MVYFEGSKGALVTYFSHLRSPDETYIDRKYLKPYVKPLESQSKDHFQT